MKVCVIKLKDLQCILAMNYTDFHGRRSVINLEFKFV